MNSSIKNQWIALPKSIEFEDDTYMTKTGEVKRSTLQYISENYLGRYEWHRMPDDVYLHKLYPTCRCGRKYVPMKGSKECFFCIFTKK